MHEQEVASLIRFTLTAAGNPSPYYDEVPEGFIIPAVFFPTPEISSSGDTLASYSFRYDWYIKFFHTDSPSAYEMARGVLSAIQAARRLVPLVTETGKLSGKYLRIRDPSLQKIDGAPGVAQLQISWDSRRPYDATLSTQNTQP